MVRRFGVGVVACAFFFGGCGVLEQETGPLPSVEEIEAFYSGHRGIRDIEVDGNVVQVEVRQPAWQIRRGGDIWARVGPYIYLFSPATRSLLVEHPSVAAVQVTTTLANDDAIARAILARDRMTEIRWRRSHNLLGHALQSGRSNPRRLEELTEWGEEHTDFWYSPRYIDR